MFTHDVKLWRNMVQKMHAFASDAASFKIDWIFANSIMRNETLCFFP